MKALPGTTTDLPNGEAGEVRNTVIELPVSMVQTLQAMVTNSQPQCNIANVLVQNGLTTNQVVSDHKQVVSNTCRTLLLGASLHTEFVRRLDLFGVVPFYLEIAIAVGRNCVISRIQRIVLFLL